MVALLDSALEVSSATIALPEIGLDLALGLRSFVRYSNSLSGKRARPALSVPMMGIAHA